MQRSRAVSSRALFPLASYKLLKHSTREGLNYTCVSCNRLMYRKTVIEFMVIKYSKAPEDFTASATCGTKQWICKTCDHALKRGKLPAQAIANCLDLEDIPPELSCRLKSIRSVAHFTEDPLYEDGSTCGKQRAIHGPAVNIPTDLTRVCTLLLRLPSQTQMVPMKLKRKLCYKGHYKEDKEQEQQMITRIRIEEIESEKKCKVKLNRKTTV